jgi:membrane protein
VILAPPTPLHRHARSALVRAWDTVWDYVRRVSVNQSEDNVFFLSAAIAFNLLLVVLPFALLVVAGVAVLLGRTADASRTEVHRVLDLLLPPHSEGAASPVHDVIDALIRARGAIGLYASIGFILFASRIFGTLRSALSDVFDIERPRSIISAKIVDTTMTLVTTLLAVAYLGVSGYLAIATPRGVNLLSQIGVQASALGWLAQTLYRLLAIGFVVAIFHVLYRYLPNRKIRWKAALLGAVVAGLMFELARNLYVAYTTTFNSNSMYKGSIFAVVSLVGWVYYGALIFLIGGEVAQAYEIRRIIRLHRETFG